MGRSDYVVGMKNMFYVQLGTDVAIGKVWAVMCRLKYV